MTAIDPDVRAVLEQVDASVPAPGGFDVAFFRATRLGSRSWTLDWLMGADLRVLGLW